MQPFHKYFPSLAERETRSVTVLDEGDLPAGEYMLLESYCSEPGCDCRRVLINVFGGRQRPKVWATINYGWESPKFYEKWFRDKRLAKSCMGATLDPLNPQTKYAPMLLDLFETVVLKDQAYVERLKRHYRLFRAAVREQHVG